jgi:hypothetical protein
MYPLPAPLNPFLVALKVRQLKKRKRLHYILLMTLLKDKEIFEM